MRVQVGKIPGILAAALLCLNGRAQAPVSVPPAGARTGQTTPAAGPQTASDVGPPGDPTAAPSDKPGLEDLAKAREKLRATEAAHPGNTVEMADALEELVGLELDAQVTDAESLELVKHEVEAAKVGDGPRSKRYVLALGTESEVYQALGRSAEARPLAELGFEIAQKDFPDTEDVIDAANHVAYACNELADFACSLRADEFAIAAERKIGGDYNWDLVSTLTNFAHLKMRMGDMAGAGAASEESLAIALHDRPNDPHVGVIENNLGAYYVRSQEFAKAIPHLNRSIELNTQLYGADNPLVLSTMSNVADLYSRTGQFTLAWKGFDATLSNKSDPVDIKALLHSLYARSLASGGSLAHAVDEGLLAARMGRENFVLQARTLPERQALDYARERPRGLDTALSVLLRHPEMPLADTYQEMVRSRALVADEMARREKNLNADNDPEVAQRLADLNQARAELLATERPAAGKRASAEAVAQATGRMEKIERQLAELSAAVRSDERVAAVNLGDLRRGLPARSVLISYGTFNRQAVERVDPARSDTPAYLAFVLRPDSERIRIFDLGDAKPIAELVARARAAADAEAHAGGLGSTRNEREYREAASSLRQKIWDPLRSDIGGAKLALVVPDGVLNLVPFSALPQGSGYLVEHGPVVHLLSSERDLVAADPGLRETGLRKTGLLAIGNPAFALAARPLRPSASPALSAALRGTTPSCDDFRHMQFQPLPGSEAEVADIASLWKRWNAAEPRGTLIGAEATRARFVQEAGQYRVLHIATHAFLLDGKCGNGNPLLNSGLVFAGANHDRETSILTAQQIASLDLSGVDWAVLSACNTGNGQLQDGEGVLGLERAFRVAGAHTVVMTLWPVDDEVTRLFMRGLYAERLGEHTTTADAVWNSARKLLLERRAAGKSTHPWYWAGFVASGGWE